MSKSVQLRRGSSAAHASFIGLPGEVTVDTDEFGLRIHDGMTLGGRGVNYKGDRTIQACLDDVVNVKNFGAKGDGVTNDAPAFARAVAAIPASGGTLMVPSGQYLLSSAGLAISSKPVHVVGGGVKATTIFCAYDGDGISYSTGDASDYFGLSHLSVVCLGTRTSRTGLKVTFPTNVGSTWKNCTINNVVFDTAGSVSGYQSGVNENSMLSRWGTFCRFTNVAGLVVDDVHVRGQWNSKDTKGIHLDGWTVDCYMHAVHAHFHDIGILKTGVLEGITITRACAIQNNRFAVIQNEYPTHSTWGGVYLNISKSHAASRDCNIDINGHPQCVIEGNLLYRGDGSDFRHIVLADCNQSTVTGNILNIGDNSDGVGVLISSSFCTVTGNTVWGVYSPVRIASGMFNVVTGNLTWGSFVNESSYPQLIRDNLVCTDPTYSTYSPGKSVARSIVTSLAGGGYSEIINVSVTGDIFRSKPSYASLTPQAVLADDNSRQLIAYYDFDNAANTATNIRFVVRRMDGGILPPLALVRLGFFAQE